MPGATIGGTPHPPAPTAPRRRHRRRPFLVRHWWVIPAGFVLAIVPLMWRLFSNPHANHDPLPGYITNSTRVEQEYMTYTGKSLAVGATTQFDHASALMREANYGTAVLVLESVAKDIPVPAVFNDLGALYARLRDGPRALHAFRDALARDHDYAPARAALKGMRLTESADPGTSEIEPNNDTMQANAVWLDRPLQATITPSVGDVDSFWFVTARPPRDRVAISVVAHANGLIPRLRLYDQEGILATGIKEAANPGGTVRFEFSPPPNTLYYIQVDGVSSSNGTYTLTVNALHAFDGYEPNDTIMTASRISRGQTVEANIMDGDDTDFYSFTSPQSGAVTIDVTPRSKALLAGLGMFAPDLQSMGFAPDPKSAGNAIHQQMKVEANQTYYIQVFSKDSAGPYSVVVK